MTDRELLEAAARAAGIEPHYPFGPGEIYVRFSGPWAFRDTSDEQGALKAWNPLTDDGDALRLAVKLRICIEFAYCADDAPVVYCGPVEERRDWPMNANFPDPAATTRRSIVRAAAAMGERG